MVCTLLQTAKTAGIRAKHNALINAYVTLKSRPFLLLVGENQTGKSELVKCLGQVLTEEPDQQCQLFVGHARWASQSQDVARFVEMQARFNRFKMLSLIEEAVQPENADKLFIACLTRISPAEMYEYFAEAGFQFWPIQVRRSDTSADIPIPYPPNFRLIGTMDTTHFVWWEAELLKHATVIQWPGEKMEERSRDPRKIAVPNPMHRFLHTCIHNEQSAYPRLLNLLQGQRQAFLPLMQVLAILNSAGVTLPKEVIEQVVVYLANAWSEEGNGLFAPLPRQNLNLALDLALVQQVLPWVVALRPGPESVLSHLGQSFNEQFEQTSAFINSLLGKPSLAVSHHQNYL